MNECYTNCMNMLQVVKVIVVGKKSKVCRWGKEQKRCKENKGV